MRFEVLTAEQIDAIHGASIRVLERTGIRLSHPAALQLFREAGALVSAGAVRIPERLVMESLEGCVRQYSIFGRDRRSRSRFGFGERNYNSTAGQAHWVDDGFLRRRPATLADVSVAARVADALEGITVVGAMSDPGELPVSVRTVEVAAALLRNTSKPVAFWFHDRPSAKYILELFAAAAGGEEEAAEYPFAYPLLEPISPLRFPHDGVDLLFETCRYPLPVMVGPMAQVGATAPATLAGTLAQENAEILAGITLVQLIRRGTPVGYGGIPHAFDMRTTQLIFAGPEQALMAAAMTQMGKHYNLPVYINVGLTDSKTVDAQAGLEAGTTLALGALSGADIFGHLGICGVDQAASLTMLVMQNELIGFVERLMAGIEVSDETLAVDIIESVASRDGSFLGEEHTAAHFRRELWFPRLLDRQFWQGWLDSGAKDLMKRCTEKKKQILAAHVVDPIDEKVDREMSRIIASARAALVA
jgi:trimethylamine--corrinoid protein Co-methyltransferase